MNLLILALDIQEEILFMPAVTSGDPRVTEKTCGECWRLLAARRGSP